MTRKLKENVLILPVERFYESAFYNIFEKEHLCVMNLFSALGLLNGVITIKYQLIFLKKLFIQVGSFISSKIL